MNVQLELSHSELANNDAAEIILIDFFTFTQTKTVVDMDAAEAKHLTLMVIWNVVVVILFQSVLVWERQLFMILTVVSVHFKHF